MGYLRDLWVPDPNRGRLYQIEDNEVNPEYLQTPTGPRAVLVDMNMVDKWTVNTTDGTVSIYNNGKRVQDIKVGLAPMGIAQDLRTGSIYVTCFKSNTLVKIVDRVVEKTISVNIGPRGICILPDGTIYIACYLASRVCCIVDDVVVNNDIKVGLNPIGICCDKYKNIWTANSGSNTASKITNRVKVMDIDVGKNPQDICVDKSNFIYTANMQSNDVSKIEEGKLKLNIPVGKAPVCLAPADDGSIYVGLYYDAAIAKMLNEKVIAIIKTCDNPCFFGDATGYKGYLTFKEFNNTSINKKISFTDLDSTLQDIISAGGGIGGPVYDADVIHDDITYSTVKKALDFLLYKAPSVDSFTNNVNTIEIGTTVSNVILNWVVNKEMVSQTISNGVGVIPIGTTTKQLTGLALTSDTAWSISVTDAKNTAVKSTSINFRNKRYWGASAKTTLNNTDIISLNGELAADYRMTKDMDASGGKYLYVAVPSSFGLDNSKFKVGGLSNSDWVKTVIPFTNASGYTSNYDVFRSGNIQNGSVINVAIV